MRALGHPPSSFLILTGPGVPLGCPAWHDMPLVSRELRVKTSLTSGNLLCDAGSSKLVLCDNLEGWDREGGGRKFQEGRDRCIHMWLIHVDVW